MNENKRFDIFTELLHTGIGITDNGQELTGNDVVDLLNEQHETIQQSRKELSDYSCTIIQLQDKVDVREALLKQLEDEYKQLKKELESFKPVIFESDGKPVTLYKKGDVE